MRKDKTPFQLALEMASKDAKFISEVRDKHSIKVRYATREQVKDSFDRVKEKYADALEILNKHKD